MRLKESASFMEAWLAPPVKVLGNIGAGVIAVMMLITVADVAGRYIFGQPVLGTYELSEFMLVIVVFFTIAHCELLRGHVTIDLAVLRLRQRAQDIINSIMYFFFLVLFIVLTWRLVVYATEQHGGYLTGALEIPVFPFIYVAALGCGLLSLVVLMHFLLFLAGALKK